MVTPATDQQLPWSLLISPFPFQPLTLLSLHPHPFLNPRFSASRTSVFPPFVGKAASAMIGVWGC